MRRKEGHWSLAILRISLDAEGVIFNSRWQRHRNAEKNGSDPARVQDVFYATLSGSEGGSLSIPVALPPAHLR